MVPVSSIDQPATEAQGQRSQQALDHELPASTAISSHTMLATNPSALEIQWHQDVIHLIRNLPSNLTDEQSILGLFCCHSIVSFDELLENQPSAKEMQARFRDFIASLWTQWLNNSIKKDDMIAAMFRWVRNASTLTQDLDIIEEFVAWFENQYGSIDSATPNELHLSSMLSESNKD